MLSAPPKISMQRRAATAALLALAWICPGPLLAKPTRTPSRPATRLIATSPAPHSSRARAAHSGTVRASHAASPSQSARTGRHAEAASVARTNAHHSGRGAQAAEAASVSARSTTRRRSKAQEKAQRETAARDAIRAADRSASRALAAKSRLPDDGTATGDDPARNASTEALNTAPELSHMKSIEEQAVAPILAPPLSVTSLYDARGHLKVPRPLLGSHEILLHQNQMADHDGLLRVRDDADLADLLRAKKLVPLPADQALLVDERLPDNRRYSRPWTAEFLAILSHDYYSIFHQPLQITSAVRTVAVQQRLVRTNGNAAAVTGEAASPHLTGQAIDIAKKGLSLTEIAWMRTYLAPLIDQGKIDVEEEFQQSCFHISVYKEFLPALPHVTVAATRQLYPERPTE